MRNLIFLFLLVSLSSCGSFDFMRKSVAEKDEIRLGELSDRYIDLTNYPYDTITVTGKYKGDRIVLKNAQNVVLNFDKAVINTEKTEDAIAVLGDATNFAMIGNLRTNNSITFWGKLTGVEITGLHSRGAHTGIRFTSANAHSNVWIHDNTISETGYEGIYAGPSYENGAKLKNIRITDNRVVRTGWDAIQVGNCESCTIYSNKIINPAKKKEAWQDYAITINPGSLVYLRGNVILNSKKRLQVLDSRAFWF